MKPLHNLSINIYTWLCLYHIWKKNIYILRVRCNMFWPRLFTGCVLVIVPSLWVYTVPWLWVYCPLTLGILSLDFGYTVPWFWVYCPLILGILSLDFWVYCPLTFGYTVPWLLGILSFDFWVYRGGACGALSGSYSPFTLDWGLTIS